MFNPGKTKGMIVGEKNNDSEKDEKSLPTFRVSFGLFLPKIVENKFKRFLIFLIN